MGGATKTTTIGEPRSQSPVGGRVPVGWGGRGGGGGSLRSRPRGWLRFARGQVSAEGGVGGAPSLPRTQRDEGRRAHDVVNHFFRTRADGEAAEARTQCQVARQHRASGRHVHRTPAHVIQRAALEREVLCWGGREDGEADASGRAVHGSPTPRTTRAHTLSLPWGRGRTTRSRAHTHAHHLSHTHTHHIAVRVEHARRVPHGVRHRRERERREDRHDCQVAPE